MESRAHHADQPGLESEVARRKKDNQLDQHPRQLSTKDAVIASCIRFIWELASPKGLGMFECIFVMHMSLARCVCVHVGCIAGPLYYLSNLKSDLQVSGLSEREEEENRSLGWLSRAKRLYRHW